MKRNVEKIYPGKMSPLVGIMKTSTLSSASELETALKILSDSHDTLRESLFRLADRLKPITKPEPPAPTTGAPVAEPTLTSERAQQVLQMSRSVQELEFKVNSLIDIVQP